MFSKALVLLLACFDASHVHIQFVLKLSQVSKRYRIVSKRYRMFLNIELLLDSNWNQNFSALIQVSETFAPIAL